MQHGFRLHPAGQSREKRKSSLKKFLVLAMTIALIAYFFASGADDELTRLLDLPTNQMGMMQGNLQIQQVETQRNAERTAVQTYDKGTHFQPVIHGDGADVWTANEPFNWGASVLGRDEWVWLWPDALMEREVDRFVSVKNVGDLPAYCRTVFAFETPAGVESGRIHLNFNQDERIQWSEWINGVVIGGDTYALRTATFKQPLQPGETTVPSLLQMAMDRDTPINELMLINGYNLLFTTQAVPAVESYYQPQNPNQNLWAQETLNTFLGEITPNVHPWSN